VSQDGPIPSAARPELSRPRRCLDEPLSPLVLSHFQLAGRSQRHPCPQISLPVRTPNPHMALLSNAQQRSGAPAIGPPLFLSCGCVLPSSLFSPAPVSPCASRTRHGLTAWPDDAAFSHWPRRTRIITIGPFPPCGATGAVGSARGRKRGGIEAVRWGSVSVHRSPVIVQSCTWYCLTTRHFPDWPRGISYPQSACAHPVFLMTSHGRGDSEAVRQRIVVSTCRHGSLRRLERRRDLQ